MFSFPWVLFSMQVFSPPKKCPQVSCSLMLCPEGAKILRTLLLEEVILKDTNLPFGSVSVLVISSKSSWSRTSMPFEWVSPGKKKIGTSQVFLIWCVSSWLILASDKIQISLFWLLQNESAISASSDVWCHQHWHIPYCSHWIIRKKNNTVLWFLSIVCRDSRDLFNIGIQRGPILRSRISYTQITYWYQTWGLASRSIKTKRLWTTDVVLDFWFNCLAWHTSWINFRIELTVYSGIYCKLQGVSIWLAFSTTAGYSWLRASTREICFCWGFAAGCVKDRLNLRYCSTSVNLFVLILHLLNLQVKCHMWCDHQKD